MASPIQLKRSQTSGNVPPSLAAGELAVNIPDRLAFINDGQGVIRSVNLTSDVEKIAASAPIGGALNLRYNTTSGNATTRTGLFWTSWNQTAAGGLPPPTGRVGAAKLQKLQDRIQIGLAAINDGSFPSTSKDPLETFESNRSDPRGFRTSWSQFAVGAEQGGIAVLGYAFASSITDSAFAGIQLGMGGCFTSVNDNTNVQQLMTGLYAVAFRLPGTGTMQGTGTCGAEIDIANEGNSLSLAPSSTYPAGGFTIGLQLNSGAISPYATDASAALTLGFNGAKFLTGVVVGQNAITGVTFDSNGNASGGYGSVWRSGVFQGFEWWNNNGSAYTSRITSRQLTPANQQEIAFEDTGIVMGGAALAGRSFQALYVGTSSGAWLQTSPAVGSNPCTITVAGQTNADFAVTAIGTGRLVLDRGTSVQGSAGALVGYLQIGLGGDPTGYCIPVYKRS